jgi:hypothetical protein
MKIRPLLIAISTIIGTCVTIGTAPVQASTPCQETGENCVVGERGPKGGIIFYDAGSQQWWGRYLEAQPGSVEARVPWHADGFRQSIYGPGDESKRLQRQSMAIGMGRENTERMRLEGTPLALTGFSDIHKDWYLPSKDELDALYNFRVQNFLTRYGFWDSVPMWTSSESEPGFAWYQLFQDGTQFTDAQGILPGLKQNTDKMRSPVHVGSDFPSLPMSFVRIRAFPSLPVSSPPFFMFVNSVRENAECSTKALNCTIGDRGPAGGIVVYDAGSDQQWGRYLEIAPQSCEIVKVAFNSTSSKPTLYTTNVERSKAKAIGMGARNTTMLAEKFAGAAKAANDSMCNNYSDWFLPSKDELNEAFRHLSHSRTGLQLTPVGGFDRGYYWTSSDYNGATAWAQYFADGQQFDRVQTLDGNRKPPARPFRVRPMRAFKSGDVSGGAVAAVPVATPAQPQSITIQCERTTVSGKPGIICDGTAKGFSSGQTLIPYYRFPGETAYSAGSARPEIWDGEFVWQRKTGKKMYLYFTSSDGVTRSNQTIIAAG